MTEDSRTNKGGRPKKPENELRQHCVKVYFDASNYRKLLNRSRRSRQSLSAIVYDLAVNGYVREPFTKEALSLLRGLSGMANNLNQLARRANTYGYQAVASEVSEVVGKIDNLLIRFSEK